MLRFIKRTSKKTGLSPGSLIHIGEQKIEKAKISLMHYDAEQLLEKTLSSIEDTLPYKDTPPVTWINIDGLHDVGLIEKIGHDFGIHPLVLEDVVNTGQRPKVDDFGDYLFIVLKMLSYDETNQHVNSEQVSFILGARVLITFQEAEGDVFDFIRARIRKGKGRIRNMKCDYLTYALIDALVDHYFIVLEKIGERIEDVEETLLDNPRSETLEEIHRLKREMIFFRKQIWPLRDVINGLMKEESSLIDASIRIFFRDISDHVTQVNDAIDSFSDMLSGMMELYLSTLSNKMNEVMKMLTIMASIFIPLTFIAGIYGMNFKYMPELDWRWSYPVLWGIMAVIFVLMLLWFKRKKWL